MSYPNRDALRAAHDIYLNAMRPFVTNHTLEEINGEIDISDIARIITNNWFNSFKRWFENVDPYYEARSAAWQIVESRNRASHPPWDLDPEFTRAHLFLIARVLEKIDRADAKRSIETIRDQLFSDNIDKQQTEVEQIAVYKKRLTTISSQLAAVIAEKATAEKRLSDISNQLEDVEIEKTEMEKRLKTMLDQLKRENAAYKKRIETISDQLEAANAEKTKPEPHTALAQVEVRKQLKKKSSVSERYTTDTTEDERNEVAVKVAKLRINASGSKPLSWRRIREKLGLKNDQFHKVIRLSPGYRTAVIERIKSLKASEEGWEYSGKLEVLTGIELTESELEPNSITFQGTTFMLHSDEYYAEGDDITQSFWHYWHAQGPDGKEKMRQAGWSVERVDGDWEITISSEDFQAWIEHEVTELSKLFNSSRNQELSPQPVQPVYERTTLPTGREMEQPVLELLADEKEHRRLEFINLLTEHFSLTDDERSYLSKTGQAEKHLMNKGLIERTRTGYYRITTRGLQVLR